MRFLIDENLSPRIAEMMQSQGHETFHVAEINILRGQPDEVVFDYAQSYDLVVVTRDVGMSRRMIVADKKPVGIVLIRTSEQIRAASLLSLIRDSMDQLSEADFVDSFVIIEPGVCRIHKLK